jgi:hypothetical protein
LFRAQPHARPEFGLVQDVVAAPAASAEDNTRQQPIGDATAPAAAESARRPDNCPDIDNNLSTMTVPTAASTTDSVMAAAAGESDLAPCIESASQQ